VEGEKRLERSVFIKGASRGGKEGLLRKTL